MNCRLCGHVIDSEWWQSVVRHDFLNSATIEPAEDTLEEEAEYVEFCLIYPEKAKIFCEDCWHWKIDKNKHYYRYRSIQSYEEIVDGIAKTLTNAAKKIATIGFFSRCERMGGSHGYGSTGRCRMDAKHVLEDGHKVCGYCFNAIMDGKRVSFIEDGASDEEPPALKYAKMLLSEICPGH